MEKQSKMLLEAIMAECDPQDRIEVYSDVPNPAPDAELNWRIRVRGRGVYIGRAHLDEKNMGLEDPHTFIPETKSSVIDD
jgi:hypothetical protein